MDKKFIYALLVKTTKDFNIPKIKTSAELVFGTLVHLTQGPIEALLLLSMVQLKIAEKVVESTNEIAPHVIENNNEDICAVLNIVNAYTLLMRDEPELINELQEKMKSKAAE
jgi:hypothetical protein